MLGFLKKFVSRSDNSTAAVAPPAPPARPVATSRPASTRPPLPARPAVRPAAPLAKPGATVQAGKAAIPASAKKPLVKTPDTDFVSPVQTAAQVTGFVEVPFKRLFAKLAPEVQALPHNAPSDRSALFQLPLAIVCDQLARGSIKLTFDEFCRFSPDGVFPADATHAEVEIVLPLSEIVPHIKAGQLLRRPNQRVIEVPDDIAPLFNSAGKPVEGLKVSSEAKKPAKPMGAKAPTPSVAAVPVPVSPRSAPAQPAVPSIAFKKPVSVPEVDAVPVAPITPISAPVAAVAPEVPDQPIRAPRLDPALATLKPRSIIEPQSISSPAPQEPAAVPAPAKKSRTSVNATFHLALMDLAAHWTSAGKEELANLYRHSLEMPMDRVESGLKKGRLVFPWREFRPWIKLAAGNTLATLADDYEVDLPLSIIAPRFLEELNPTKFYKKSAELDDFPDVFEVPPPSNGETAPPKEEAPAAQAPQPVIVAPAAEAEVEVETPVSNRLMDYPEIFGQPSKHSWTLPEIADATSRLRGVDGALISDGDGLLIAGAWSGDIAPESVAAFLPQMYRRILEYSIELKLGDSTNFILTVENVPLNIFKTGSNYLAVLGKAGENLPKGQLTAIAKRLAQPVK